MAHYRMATIEALQKVGRRDKKFLSAGVLATQDWKNKVVLIAKDGLLLCPLPS